MSIQTQGNGQLAKAPQQKPAEQPQLIRLVENMKGEIARALPKHLSPDRMARIAVTALRTTKDLGKCDPASFIACLMGCSVLGLEPNTPLGQAYLIPFWNGKEKRLDCQLIVGYQGFIDLVRRSGLVASVQAFAVYQGDTFSYELGLNPTIKHIPSERPDREDPAKLTHAYCVVKLKDKDADPIFLVMTRQQIEKRKLRGAAGKKNRDGDPVFTPWQTDYEAMALKTVVRAAIKWAPRSAEMAHAVAIDERSERDAPIAPALPAEIQQHLLEGGHVAEAEFVDVEGENKTPDPAEEFERS